MIVYVCCGGTESHCAKWPVTEVFHVNPMIHTEPHVTVHTHHRRHTHSALKLTPYTDRPMKAHAHTYAREQAEHDEARRHLLQCIQSGYRPGCSRMLVLIEMITILCFTSGVLFYWYRKWRRTPNKQTNKSESGGGGGGYGGLSRQQTFEWETRDTWLVNSHWHDKPGKIHIRKIFIHSFTSNRIVLPSCALLSLLHLYIKQQHVFFSLSTPFTSLTIC